MKQSYWLILLGVITLAAVAGSFIVTAQAQTDRRAFRFEYAWMYLPDDGRPVFSRAEIEITILPSSERLSGAVESREQGMRRYTLETRSARDDAAAALDIAGQAGWEAVSAVSHGKGIKVLLKRPV